ncbi:MAG: flippase-like domain-containing protein [Spirochaetes bacterium]|nr:flippase-like domain-containing protein [Spirochaetota bacterium]
MILKSLRILLKNIFLFLPVIYSIIQYGRDPRFYFVAALLYSLFILYYYIKRRRKYYLYLVQLGVSCLFLDLTFHNIDFKSFYKAFQLIDIKILLLITLVLFILTFFRAFKWKYLFPDNTPVKFVSLIKTVFVGFMVNYILPVRAGEVYRAFFLNKIEKVDKSMILGTVVIDRLFDGLIVGLGIIVIFLLNIIRENVFYKVGLLGLGFYVLAVLFLIIFYFRKKNVLSVIKKLLFFTGPGTRDKVLSILDKFYEGLHVFNNRRNFFLFLLFTLLVWLLIGVTNYLYLYSMDIFNLFKMNVSPVFFTLLFLCLLVLGVSVPSGPGAIGPFQASIFFAFFLINPVFIKAGTNHYNIVASLSMYIWIFQVFFFVITGLFVFTREHLKLKV